MKRLLHCALLALALFAAAPASAQVTTDATKTGDASAYIGSFAWTSLPAASSYTGARARVSDYGISPGLMVVSDGTRWLPDGVQVLARGNVAVPVTGTTSKTAMATITVPAGLLGTAGQLRLWPIWSSTNNANAKNGIVDFGSTTIMTQNLTSLGSTSAMLFMRNRGSASSQLLWLGSAVGLGASSGSGISTISEDTSVNKTLTISGQLGTSTDTITLEGYVLEVLP